MRNIISIVIILLFSHICFAQLSNDSCENASVIVNVSNYCSADKEFSTETSSDGEVWFQFTARAFDVNVSVSGNTDGTGNLGGTMNDPAVELFNECNTAQIVTSQVSSDNVTSLYKGGLIIGHIYYIRVSGRTKGSFKLCINNYNPIFKPGQDCSSASVLCSKETFTQTDVSGGGLNSDEAAGTCLSAFGVNSEQNSAWYKWTAANSGSLTFVITPTANDDIDWVLFDLGTVDDCGAVNPGTAIRCNAGRGVDCFGPGEKRYTRTGLDANSSDLFENGGCKEGQDGFVRFVNMEEGHIYALLVNNFDRGNNGFTIEFGGTGQFLGPKSEINMQVNNTCTPEQSFTFTSLSANYNRLKWTFGEGASLDSADAAGPLTVTYRTPGIKTVVLQAIGDNDCSVVSSKTFTVAFKPEPPPISASKNAFCLNEIISLTTPALAGATYSWSGPNNFKSDQRAVNITITDNSVTGLYSLSVTLNGCTSDLSTFTIPPISPTPEIRLEVVENNACSIQQNFTVSYPGTNYVDLKADLGQGAAITSGSGNGPYEVNYNTPGQRTITITATGSTGCIVTLTKIIDVPEIPSKPVIQSNKTSFCVNDTIRLSTAAKPNTTFTWAGPNNFIATGTAVSIPVSSINVAGEYRLTATLGRCSIESESLIISDIINNPVAAFTSEPGIPATLTGPVSVEFTNQSTGADTYLWDFGDGTTSAEANPVHEYTAYGKFDIKLTATKSNACSTSVVQGQLFISADNKIFIPNTFTPNADQVNDEFVVKISNINSYRIQIFNRYGSPLFNTNDIFDHWKGIYNNKPLPVGTYYYVIDAVSVSGQLIKKSGPISIIK